MFFKDYFNSIADQLDAKYRGIQRQKPDDKGELCEVFIKDFLTDFLSDQFKIFRGGNIINIDGSKSRQLDVILTAKNTIKIFDDKGFYPIESVYAVFSITSTLNHPKLLDCFEEFKSIPKQNPHFEFHHPLDRENVLKKWKERFPFKCIFGFTGSINQKWEDELNGMVNKDMNLKEMLPDFTIINKKGTVIKIHKKPCKMCNGSETNKDFHYTDFNQYKYYGAVFPLMLNELYFLSTWQESIAIPYQDYFNKEL